MTSYATFLSAVQALTVTGVSRHYDEPPASLDLSGGPCAFPLMPGGAREDLQFSCVDMGKTKTIGYVIAVEAAGQGTQAQNYGQLAALMDNLETALDTLVTGGTFTFITYSITTNTDNTVSGNEYWQIIATIQGRNQ